MEDLDPLDRGPAKRDRTARLMRVASLLDAHPEGMRPKDIAERLGMSVRNVYRDLKALEGEVGLPTWSEDGPLGNPGVGLPAAAEAEPLGGDGGLPRARG